MGPTCSIVYENEPLEYNTMKQKPRAYTNLLFNWKELSTSIVQGLAITFAALFVYLLSVQHGFNEQITRTMVFLVLITANILLTLVNRSFHYSIFTTLKYKNNLIFIIIGITAALTIASLYIPPIRSFFMFGHLNFMQLYTAIGIGAASVLWYEFVKLWKRKKAKSLKS